jgi:hypothetical protein
MGITSTSYNTNYLLTSSNNYGYTQSCDKQPDPNNSTFPQFLKQLMCFGIYKDIGSTVRPTYVLSSYLMSGAGDLINLVDFSNVYGTVYVKDANTGISKHCTVKFNSNDFI